MTIQKAVALSVLIASVSTGAFAVEGRTGINNLNHRPVDQIAADLGVEPDEFVACFIPVQPAAPGTEPTRAREQSNKAVLLPCLQAANSAITNDMLDTVMDRYRGVYVE